MNKFEFLRAVPNGTVVLGLVSDGSEVLNKEKTMKALNANSTEAAVEKHIPDCKREGNHLSVVVGSVEHPMTEEHLIDFIAVEQGNHLQVAKLTSSDAPKATFTLADGPATVYAYCNLHGMWKAEV